MYLPLLIAVTTCTGTYLDDGKPPTDLDEVMIGRIVDERLAPVANARIRWLITVGRRGESSSRRLPPFLTDDEGRFRLFIPAEVPQGTGGYRTITLAGPDRANQDPASAVIDLSHELDEGMRDAGNIVLATPGSDVHLRSFNNRELEHEYRRIRQLWERGLRLATETEACTLEMARRGGEHWIEFLDRELRESQRYKDRTTVELMTALRRAQRKPDPLAIEVTSAKTPGTVHFRFRNVDEEPLVATLGGSYRIHGEDESGTALPVKQRTWIGSRVFSLQRIEPGGVKPGSEFDLTDFVTFPGAGLYRVQIQYHDTDDIAGARSIRGRIVTTSAEVTIRVSD